VAVDLLPLARERGIDWGLETPTHPLPCVGDPVLLKQAVLNLAHNAIEHGHPSGVVTLCASAQHNGFSLQVTDDGPGLPPELVDRVGQRFAKGRHSGGSGLGLAIAQSVIQSHGGQLRVGPSTSGAGLCVGLWWPA
jgi:two-component system sensor histidine kinase TctE